MKIPTPRKLSSGKWFIQLRLDGRSVSISNFDKTTCIREAQAIKSQYILDRHLIKQEEISESSLTLSKAIDRYISARSNTIAHSTIRGYRIIQKNRFQTTMPRKLKDIDRKEWQEIVNAEAALCSPKTLKNSLGFLRSVVAETTGEKLPKINLPGEIVKDANFLTPEQIKIFVAAVKDTRYAVPALLALSSLRISEIHALRWEAIPKNPEFIRVSGVVVLDEHNQFRRKAQNKNRTSARNVPILIPELETAIERDRQSSGPVLAIHQNSLRVAIKRICRQNGLPEITLHGLRHSFASLAYHLHIPERIAMEMGGWSDPATMQKIYTHIAQSDINRYKTSMADFYAGKDQKEVAESVSKSS